ncbi:hypothetical protein [Geodermatophilus obscurus]|uniref:hypothetical protein n=1 Tax=Geodermatophilus obscurus TaxID=1861 RepID=UPI001FCA8A67|nr:hypothetical protein [Geodermatophilus obscurus]
MAKLVRSWCSFLAGDQPGDRGPDGVEVLASAEVPGQGSPVLRVADAVLDADPRGRVRSAFGLVCRGDGGETGIWFFRRAGRGVSTAPAVWVLRPW